VAYFKVFATKTNNTFCIFRSNYNIWS